MSTRDDKINEMLEHRLASVVLVAEATHLRHNLSAMIRSAEAFGVHNVHLISSGMHTPKGSARGAECWVKLHHHLDTRSCIETLKSRGFKVYAADFQQDSYTPETLPIDQPIAIVMGTELRGVSPQAQAMVDGTICIPMSGQTQSLNVSVATACILFRLTERRREIIGAGDLSDEEKISYLKDRAEKKLEQKRVLERRYQAGTKSGKEV